MSQHGHCVPDSDESSGIELEVPPDSPSPQIIPDTLPLSDSLPALEPPTQPMDTPPVNTARAPLVSIGNLPAASSQPRKRRRADSTELAEISAAVQRMIAAETRHHVGLLQQLERLQRSVDAVRDGRRSVTPAPALSADRHRQLR